MRHIRAVDRPARRRSYLGDGVYIAYDGFGFWLTAEDGLTATDAIYLEPQVYQQLVRFVTSSSEPLGDGTHCSPIESWPQDPEHYDERGSEPA